MFLASLCGAKVCFGLIYEDVKGWEPTKVQVVGNACRCCLKCLTLFWESVGLLFSWAAFSP